MQRLGLTKGTCSALRQTCHAIVGLAKHLANFCGFNYVRLGKVQSDMLEGRFGHIRQLSGGNYYISMRQLLESDRKLRAVSLLKHSGISVKDINRFIKAQQNEDGDDSELLLKAESLYGDLHLNTPLTENDVAVTYSVTGFCCRSLVNTYKCEKCKEAAVAATNNCSNDKIPENASEFLKDINRGGLFTPTSEMFEIGCLCWKIFAELCQEPLRKTFLCGMNHRNVFIEIVNMAFYEGTIISPWTVLAMCDNGHNILTGFSVRFFNCMCKNLLREINELEATEATRKIRKIIGKNAKN